MANSLNVDLGRMILVGCLVGFPSSVVGLLFCGLINRYVDIPMRPYSGEVEPQVQEDHELPPLWLSLLPVLLPVVLIGPTPSQNRSWARRRVETSLGNRQPTSSLSLAILTWPCSSRR